MSGHPRLGFDQARSKKDVDARNKCGHDEIGMLRPETPASGSFKNSAINPNSYGEPFVKRQGLH
jgi:hypothetical protein